MATPLPARADGSQPEQLAAGADSGPASHARRSPAGNSAPSQGERASRGLAPSAPESDSAASWDRLLRARVGRLSFGLSPPGLLMVSLDWLVHLAFSPGKQVDLAKKLARKA